jgi:hypothetical protein
MQRTLNLQEHSQPQKPFPSGTSHESDDMTRDWISAINTSILTTLSPTTAGQSKDRTGDLSRLMQSPEFASILVGAKHLAETQGLSPENATDRLIRSFREMDEIWRQIVIERGLKAIID